MDIWQPRASEKVQENGKCGWVCARLKKKLVSSENYFNLISKLKLFQSKFLTKFNSVILFNLISEPSALSLGIQTIRITSGLNLIKLLGAYLGA
jgi:hypothetical protein